MFLRLVSALIVALPVLAQPPARISGSVPAEQTFRKEIGSGLFFVVSPIKSVDSTGFGWSLSVEPSDRSDHFERCVATPLHGPTPNEVLAWEFVTGENENLPASELAPLKKRVFPFVLNASDQKKACDELEVVAGGRPAIGKDGAEIIGTPGYKPPPLGTATVTLKSIPLADVGKGKHARFESLGFEAEFVFPQAPVKRPTVRRRPL